jgi:hypothetical protein
VSGKWGNTNTDCRLQVAGYRGIQIQVTSFRLQGIQIQVIGYPMPGIQIQVARATPGVSISRLQIPVRHTCFHLNQASVAHLAITKIAYINNL